MIGKTILKLALLVVTVVMICPVAGKASSKASEKEQIMAEKVTHHLKESNSASQYEKLMDSFEQTETGELIYPNYYGGSYIDDDGGFVVCVAAANAEEEKYASTSIEETINASDFKIKNVTYSYNELEEMMEFLNKYKQNTRDSEIAKSWFGHFLSESDNTIFVQLSDVSDEQIALFKREVTDSPMISFIKGGQLVDCANLNSEKDTSDSTMDVSASMECGERGLRGKLALLQLLTLTLWGRWIL